MRPFTAQDPILGMAVGALFMVPGPAGAQPPASPDTLTYQVQEIVVTAWRGRDTLQSLPAPTYAFSRQQIRQSGATRISNLLARLPGLFGYQQNSNGDVSTVDPRGFTANGVTSYVKLLVNGQDVRDTENGSVDWDWLLPEQVERLEVVEGAAAWLYGDGAEGGVVNVVRPEAASGYHSDCALRGGTFGLRAGSIALAGRGAELDGSLRGAARQVDGWRANSRERVYAPGGELRWSLPHQMRLSLDAAWLDADRKQPGTLTPAQLRVDRSQAETHTDFVHSKRLVLGSHLEQGAPDSPQWTFAPYLRTEDVDQVSTVLFQPQSHPTSSLTAGADVGWSRGFTWAGRALVFSAGAEGEQARLRSKYFPFTNGGRGALETDGESRRTTGAGFANVRIGIDPLTSVRAGFREDAIRVRSESRNNGLDAASRTFWSGSPFVAVSRRFSDRFTAYASYSTLFHAPTLNQLFDRRPFFDPFTFSTLYLSNPGLRPSRGRSVEAGGRLVVRGGGQATLALYSIRVRQEIDFDAATLSYANIGRSWHRGVQAGFQQPFGAHWVAEINGTYSPTTIRGGPDDGNQINAVPLGTGYGSLRWADRDRWSLEGNVRFVGHQYLDKANQHRLPDFTTLELIGTARLFRLHATVSVGNLLDRKYSDTGFFVDFTGEERLVPAPGRNVTVGLSLE